MPVTPPQPTPLREIDVSHYVRHYFSLIWRWKWWIAISGPVVSAVVLIYMVKIAPTEPELTAKVLIGLENTQSMSAVMDFVDVDNSKAEIIETRNFLKDIVRQLSMQFVLKKYPRQAIISEVKVDSLAKIGKYTLTIDKENMEGYTVTFSNRRLGFNNKVVESGKLAKLEVLKLPGVFLQFSRRFLRDPHGVTFYILSTPRAIENLHNRISVRRPDMRKIFHIEIFLEGRDYTFIAEILNAIADAFVEKKLMFKRRKTQNVLVVLEKQHKKARDGLAGAESSLRNFRTSNPTIGLTSGAQQTVNTIIGLETNAFAIKSSLKEAEKLKSKFLDHTQDDNVQVAEETLIFLSSYNNTTAPVLQMELNRLLAEKRALKSNYSSSHPLKQTNRTALEKLLRKVDNALTSFIQSSREEAQQKTTGIQSLSAKLQRLPSKELRMAELQRRHQVNAEIYSKVLDRYNQAKLAETVEVADTYVMDYAAPPAPPPLDMLKILGICLLLGLGVAFGPPIALDMISKTVHTEFELRKMTSMLVLEAIPEIIPEKRQDENSRKKETKKK